MKKLETGNILCGLVGANSSTNGEYEASWLFPLFDHEKRADFDEKLAVFPGFTYDSKTKRRVKTSLLWRLFRHENDPEKSCKVDFLFVPVWR